MKNNITEPRDKKLPALLVLLLLAALHPAISRAYVPPLTPNTQNRPDFDTMTWPQANPKFPPPGKYDITKPPPEFEAELKLYQQQPNPLPQPEKKKPDIEIKGYRYFRFRTFNSNGNKQRFLSMEGLLARNAKLEQGTDLTIAARPSKKLSLTGSFYEMPQQDRQMNFALGSGNYKLNFGDLSVSFKGGTFSPFSKKITGFEMDYGTGRTQFQLISSKSKSQTHTVTFSGRNIKGPYDLGANDLIPESISIRVNNQAVPAASYILDAFIGEITFYDIIGPNDIVTVTFEQRLRGSLTEGNIMGFSGGYANGIYKAGFSHLVQQANASAQTVERSVTDETATLSGNILSVANKFIVRTLDRGTETIKKSNGGVITTLEAGVDYNSALTDAQRMENYRFGRFTLSNPDPSATYLVSYSYYPENTDAIQQQFKERLVPLGAVATLQKQTVYYGSEDVYVCYDDTLETIRLTLVRGVDYDIDENANRITFRTHQDEPFLRIDYYYYPLASVASTKYDHTVDDFSLNLAPAKNLLVEAETATSKSDISNKPIQVLREPVAFVPGTLNCETGFIRTNCTFSLSRKNIVSGSQTVYYNDRLVQDNILSEYTQYTVDTRLGTIEIKTTIPAGTTIYADYQYLSDRPPGLATGNIWRLGSSYNNGKTLAEFNLKGANTAFTPIGSENNMEVGVMAWKIAHKLNPSLDISADSLTTDTATDLDATNKNTSTQERYQMNWNPKSSPGGLKLGLDYSTRIDTDDRAPHMIDTNEKTFGLTGGARAPFLKHANFTFGLSSQNHNDNPTGSLGAASGNRTKKHDFGFDWKPDSKLSFNTAFNSSDLNTFSAGAEYTAKNNSQSSNITYTPVELLTLGMKIDKQATSDTRPGSAPSSINQNMIRLDTKPFWKFSFISLVKTQDDHPSVNTPSTHSETTNMSTSLIITKALSFSPARNTSKSSFGGMSSSTNENNTYELAWRPPGRPYHVTVGSDKGTRSSTGLSISNAFTVATKKVELGYNPSKAWAFSTNFQKESDSSTAGPSDSFTNGIMNVRLRYTPGERRDHWILYNKNNRGGMQPTSYSVLELGLDYRLSQMFKWDFVVRHSNSKDKSDNSQSYRGNVIESSLRIEF